MGMGAISSEFDAIYACPEPNEISQFIPTMADVVDLLHINDITVMRTLDPEDILADWKDTKLLARVLIDNELLDETGACLPIMHEGVSARPAARWELGGFQVPTDCPAFTLIIATASCFEIFRFEIRRGLDGIWIIEIINSERICRQFRTQVFLCHPSSNFHRRFRALPSGGVMKWDIPRAEPWDKRIGPPQWLWDSFPAEQLLLLGFRHYGWARSSHGDNRHLKLVLAALERALEDPNIDSGLSQVVETIIPFLHCLEQGYRSCLDVAFQVLQTFPGLLDKQYDAQFLLHMVVFDVVEHFEWHDHIPLAIKLITGPLKLLLHSATPVPAIWNQYRLWVTLAYYFASNAKEVLPLMDLVVNFHSGFPTLEGFESLAMMMRATVYFRQAIKPDGPSLGMTLGAAELVMHSSAGREHSPHLGPTFKREFVRSSTTWLLDAITRNLADLKPSRGRLLSFVAWQLSRLPSHPEVQDTLKAVQSRLRGNMRIYEIAKGRISQPPTLDDNDNQFIEEAVQDLSQQTRGKEIPAEYPKGAAELVRNFLLDADSGLSGFTQYWIIAVIARALRLPEAFKAYEFFMGSVGEDQSSTLDLFFNALRGPGIICLVIRDAISCASETGNHASALQWSDQRCSQIWNWHFHSHLSIGQSSPIDPVAARVLKTHPRWIDSWEKRQQDERCYHVDGKHILPAISGYNLLPGLEHFLRPKTPAEIISLAEVLGGPIVYLNPNRYSSHALAVLPGLDDVIHIPLSRMDYPGLCDLSVEFMKSPQSFLREEFSTERKGFMVKPAGTSQSPPKRRNSAGLLLEQLWIEIVKPVLDELGIQHAETRAADMPRIWWCPSGPLIGLPIHAAGIYTGDEQGVAISDYVVSSYFPSASALAYATRPEDPSQKFSLLTIANPTGAGLPGTEWELEKIKVHTATQELTHGEATVEAVKKGMENASWAHFACHGVSNPDKPWESALKLANHTRLTLREISNMSLPHAEFAYLSACQTAKGVAEAPDQSAHLSVGMMACGYRSVIGTLWSIKDEYAPIVADRVYAKMLEGGRPDYKRAAYALHDAVQALRKEHNVGFATWLPFIHVGV